MTLQLAGKVVELPGLSLDSGTGRTDMGREGLQIPDSRPLAVRTGSESVSLSDTSHFARQSSVGLVRREIP